MGGHLSTPIVDRYAPFQDYQLISSLQKEKVKQEKE